MPNNFAYFMLIAWPLIAIFFYKRMPIVNATFWTIVGGFLFLPVKTAIDFPFIPPLDKESIPVISALIGCRFVKKVRIKLLPQEGVERWLILILLITPFFTTWNNQEYFNGIPGLTIHDTLSAIVKQYLFILPLVLGIQLIKSYNDQLLLFKLLVIAGLIYSIPVLFEVRMSPQLHTWIYGFFPHSFGQQVRFDGYRPVVFLGHGLIVAMFSAVAFGSAAILQKQSIKTLIMPPALVVIYLFVILFLCKTVGAFILGTTLFITITYVPLKIIKRVSLFFVFVVSFYPFLTIFDLFPHHYLVQLANDFDPSRGESLAFRFYHEGLLLEHAKEKLFFGWGGWGRNRLEESVTDGYWIITLGQFGLAGFISIIGLFSMSVVKAIKASSQQLPNREVKLLVSHALLVSVVMLDQLPNASIAAWLLFIIGALLARSNAINAATAQTKASHTIKVYND